MRDPFVFDSRSEFCKSPYGAAPCGGRVTFHVRPLYAEGYSRCVLVAWREFSNSTKMPSIGAITTSSGMLVSTSICGNCFWNFPCQTLAHTLIFHCF